MVKTRSRNPPILCVATDTLRGQLFSMLVVVTIQAIPVKSQESPVHVDLVAKCFHVVLYQLGFMAIPALQAGVLSLECVIRFVMVKIIDTPGPVNQLIVPSRVVFVTFETRFFPDYGDEVVVALLTVDPHGDLLVAFETFFVARSLAEIVAFETVFHAFKKRVCVCQISGGDLSGCLRRRQKETQAGKNTNSF